MRFVLIIALATLILSCSGSDAPVATDPSGFSSDETLSSWVSNDPFSGFNARDYADRLRFGDLSRPEIPSELLSKVSLSPADIEFLRLALEAYLWGYAPMTVYRLERAKTNSQAPLNFFFHATHLPNWQLPSPVSAPDVDVLYSSAFLDLGRGPQILTIPAIDSYYVVQIDDAYGNSQASLGLRTSPGTTGGRYLVVGPNDPGYVDPEAHLSDGFDANHVVPIDTDHAWIIVRVPVDAYSVSDSPDSLEQSQAYTETTGFTLAPLSGVERRDPMLAEIASEFETPPTLAPIFFRWLGEAVVRSPLPSRAAFSTDVHPPYLMSPSASVGQEAVFESFAPVGLDSQGFHIDQLTPRQLLLLQAALELGNKILGAGQTFALNGPPSQNFWHVTATSNIGKYPNTWSGWFIRSVAAYEGGIASLAPDGTYPLTGSDANGDPLAGGQRYRIHFEPGELPPIAQGFWSLTIYTNNTASGSSANLPFLAAASVNNTAYSQVPDQPVVVTDTSHFSQPGYANNDTIFFASGGGGLAAETPYYVMNASGGSFQLSSSWNVDPTKMSPISVDSGLVGQTLQSGEVIPVYSLGSQQLAGNSLRGAGLTLNPDGSLDIFLQNGAPQLRGNWLPTPESGQFQVMMRLYNPLSATPQSLSTSILSDTTIPLTTSDPAQANAYPQEPVTRDNAHGTYVVPALEKI